MAENTKTVTVGDLELYDVVVSPEGEKFEVTAISGWKKAPKTQVSFRTTDGASITRHLLDTMPATVLLS